MSSLPADATNDPSLYELHSSCQCGQLAVSLSVPRSSLPLSYSLCACTTCRRLSGHLALTSIRLPKDFSDLKVSGRTARYETSTGPRGLSRVFCPVCGAHVYEDSPDRDRIGLAGGAITNLEDGVLEPIGLDFVRDTIDEGLKVWFPVDDPKFKISEGDSDKANEGLGYTPVYVPAPNSKGDVSGDRSAEVESQSLSCSCLCGGVNFAISRPNAASRAFTGTGSYHTARRAVPHLEHPLPSLTGHDSASNDEAESTGKGEQDSRWWLRGPKRDKYPALICACHSCRLSSGFDLQPWAFVPVANLHLENEPDKAYELGECDGPGTLKCYQSSKPDIFRYFCGTCGATAFWWESRESPLIIDVSIGLCEAASGSRAEEWFEWDTQVCYKEHAQKRDLVDMLDTGLKARGRKGEV